MPYVCTTCGKEQGGLPNLAVPAPFYWSDDLRDAAGCLLTEDLCVIRERDFFVRGVLEILVHGHPQPFVWGVWVSQHRDNFAAYRDRPDSDIIGPFFGWLSTEIVCYPVSTLGLKTMVGHRGMGLRPRIVLEPTEHPLSRQQREGITLAEAWALAHHFGAECADAA